MDAYPVVGSMTTAYRHPTPQIVAGLFTFKRSFLDDGAGRGSLRHCRCRSTDRAGQSTSSQRNPQRVDRRLRLGRHQLLLRADGDIEVSGVFVILLLGWPYAMGVTGTYAYNRIESASEGSIDLSDEELVAA